nr:MAG: hypothetical protein J07AB56_04720 [Candidatus Nanosalinarum sp. J07AB56]
MASAGLVFSEGDEGAVLAVLSGSSTELIDGASNEEIGEACSAHNVDVLAADAALRGSRQMSDAEREAQEEGHSFVPGFMDREKTGRMKQLVRRLKPGVRVVRFEARASMESLAVTDDPDLESLGADTDSISSAEGFEAVVGAVTARLVSQGSFRDEGIVVPELPGS